MEFGFVAATSAVLGPQLGACIP